MTPSWAARCAVAAEKRAAFRQEEYWGRPVPGFGDPQARVLVCGLAPAAHGGNRTGRVFTGDRSGDWLFAALHRTGFANQPHAVSRDDGLRLIDAFVAAGRLEVTMQGETDASPSGHPAVKAAKEIFQGEVVAVRPRLPEGEGQ